MLTNVVGILLRIWISFAMNSRRAYSRIDLDLRVTIPVLFCIVLRISVSHRKIARSSCDNYGVVIDHSLYLFFSLCGLVISI